MPEDFFAKVRDTLAEIDAAGLTKPERVIACRQGAEIQVGGKTVLNFCANNYLGLGGDARVSEAAARAARDFGAGMASVRFICGTHALHKELERAIADYLGYEDAILFAGGLRRQWRAFRAAAGRE